MPTAWPTSISTPPSEDPCVGEIDALAKPYILRVRRFMNDCGLLEGDLLKSDDGQFSIIRDIRICARPCQSISDFLTKLAQPDFTSLWKRCGLHELPLRSLQRVVNLVTSLEKAWDACERIVAKNITVMCPDRSMVSHECGEANTVQTFGMEEAATQCEAKGCCWDPARSGRPWCYHAAGSVSCEKKCPNEHYGRHFREDCSAFKLLDAGNHPDDNVRGKSCEDVGCCWQPLEHNSLEPWCFHVPCV